jgi:ferritin-like metal-binding protein YciE
MTEDKQTAEALSQEIRRLLSLREACEKRLAETKEEVRKVEQEVRELRSEAQRIKGSAYTAELGRVDL